MDGRCQHVNDHAVKTCSVGVTDAEDAPVVDTITEPGIDAILAGVSTLENAPSLNWLKFKAEVSVEHHGATQAVVAGHHACAGNPVSDDEHRKHIRDSVDEILSWGLFEEVRGVFVDESRGIEEIIISSKEKESA